MLHLVRDTASEMVQRMSSGEMTSVSLVRATLDQIAAHNTAENGLKLRACISVAPEEVVLARAAMLDAERAQNCIRGPLHGIPILLKACLSSVFLESYLLIYLAKTGRCHDSSRFGNANNRRKLRVARG